MFLQELWASHWIYPPGPRMPVSTEALVRDFFAVTTMASCGPGGRSKLHIISSDKIYIYIPGTQMTIVLLEKTLFFGG